MPEALIALLIVAIVLLIVFAAHVRVVRQSQKYVIERLGGYHITWETGIHLLIPIVDRVAKIISMKEQVKDFDPQPVITKDNITMQIDSVVFFRVMDPKLYAYGVENPLTAIENLAATTLRNIIGELELDETLTSRDLINAKMRNILDEATDPWGIRVNRVEVKNIIPPKDIRDAMEKQMRAERERRESILRAEGEKRSAILRAEGEAEAVVLRADAEKTEKIRRAEGDAEGFLRRKEAEALGIKLIKDSKPDKAVLALRSFEALAQVAEGQATKIIIPSELQNIAGTLVSAAELIRSDKLEE